MGGFDSGKNPPRRILKRHGPSSLQRFDVESIAAFKQMPSFAPEHFRTNRPILEKGCVCMPLRKMDWCSPEVKEMGMRNILYYGPELCPGWLSRVFPLEAYTINKPLFKPFPDISSQVIFSTRVQKAIQETAIQIVQNSNSENESDVIKSLQAQGWITIKKMRASVSAVFIKIAAWWLTRFLGNMLGGIQVSRSQMKMLKEHCKKNIPIIYLPLHRSHLDYILVTLTLWNFDIRAPYVAAGENLDIPFFNLLMRGLGGFFIRRRLDCKVGQKDLVYRAILHQYMTELLKSSEAIEFFIEGGRTRTGRAIIPKGGLLSIIVEAFNRGEIPDAYIVPASFGYERIMDGDFSREQMGLPKVNESFFGAMRAIIRVLCGYYGSIRVDFAQPFAMREFLDNARGNPNIAVDYHPLEYSSALDRHMSCSFLERSLSIPSHMSSGNGDVVSSRLLVKALADHTVYIADHSSSPMSTHLLAFLLLTKYREGVKLEDLTKDLQWMVKELQALHVDVGFCGQPKDVILYSQRLLGNKHVLKTTKSDDLYLCPNLSIPRVFQLSYYANFVTTHFALESILAGAVMHQSNLSLFQLVTPTPLPVTKLVRENLLGVAEELCLFLHAEFIFVPPCTCLENTLSELLDSFVTKEILKDEEQEESGVNDRDRQMANRIAKSLEMDDEEQYNGVVSLQSLQLNINNSDVRRRLHFLVSVLGPIMESHLIVLTFVMDRLINEMTDKTFFRELGEFARSRVQDGLSLFSESCAMLNLKLAVKSLQDLQLIYSYQSTGLVMLGVADTVDAHDQLEHYASLLKGVLS